MKVFAVVKDGPILTLAIWSSKKEFERDESWVDPKFIRVATTDDLAGYAYPIELGYIVYGADQIAAYELLRAAYLAMQPRGYKQ